MARVICHGQRGEIRKRYREGQEDQLGALGLVINAAVLWNTIYMEEALNHLKNGSIEIRQEDKARLSQLCRTNILFKLLSLSKNTGTRIGNIFS